MRPRASIEVMSVGWLVGRSVGRVTQTFEMCKMANSDVVLHSNHLSCLTNLSIYHLSFFLSSSFFLTFNLSFFFLSFILSFLLLFFLSLIFRGGGFNYHFLPRNFIFCLISTIFSFSAFSKKIIILSILHD